MAASAEKSRPANVPEENVYDKTHWLLIVTYLMAAIAVFLLNQQKHGNRSHQIGNDEQPMCFIIYIFFRHIGWT